MHVLFIHDAFPAQFGRLGLELTKRYGWKCTYLIQQLSSCPTPTEEMLQTLEIIPLSPVEERRSDDAVPWPRIYGKYLDQCERLSEVIRGRPGLKPDLIVAHGGRGAPTLFLRDVVDCPIMVYCEYYFATSHADISYRIDLPPAEPAPFFPRCINAPTLVSLVEADAGYSATNWQKDSFPERFHSKIEVGFDGIDTELYRPGPAPREIGPQKIPAGTKVVTYVARGLESVRGFDIFMKVADRIARERDDVIFVVVGGEETHYGWDKLHTGATSFKRWVLEQGDYDQSRYLFTGRVFPEALADILRISDLHIHLTAPFVLSWSLFNAMASGCVVLGSDVGPVREVIQPGANGLLEPLFDVDRLTDAALRVLRDPAAHSPLARAARVTVENLYSIESCIPRLKDIFGRVVASGKGSDARELTP